MSIMFYNRETYFRDTTSSLFKLITTSSILASLSSEHSWRHLKLKYSANYEPRSWLTLLRQLYVHVYYVQKNVSVNITFMHFHQVSSYGNLMHKQLLRSLESPSWSFVCMYICTSSIIRPAFVLKNWACIKASLYTSYLL